MKKQLIKNFVRGSYVLLLGLVTDLLKDRYISTISSWLDKHASLPLTSVITWFANRPFAFTLAALVALIAAFVGHAVVVTKSNEADTKNEDSTNTYESESKNVLRSDFKVEFIPSHGQGEERFLGIKNLGCPEGFIAQCQILARRNDPNPTQCMIYDLQWQNGGTLMVLATGQVGNILIAMAGNDKNKGMEWIQLRAFNSHAQPNSSNWNLGDKLPEYEIEITVVGTKSNESKSEKFLVRAGKQEAIEMYKLSEVPAEKIQFHLPPPKTRQESDPQQPDVALMWEFPKDVRKVNNFMGRTEKDIVVHNRSNEYVYNIQIKPIMLGSNLVFDQITELAPGEGYIAIARWDGRSTAEGKQYIYFFSRVEEEGRQKGWFQEKPNNTGLRTEWFKIPMSIHYEARNTKWETQFEFTYAQTENSFFTRVGGHRI